VTLRTQLAVAAALLLGSQLAAYAADPPRCSAIGFARGPTMFCAYTSRSGRTVLRRSDDHGAHWGAERVVAPAPAADVTGIVVSPLYHDDTTVFVATTDGVFRSSDGGNTFDVAVESGVNARFVTAYVDAGPAGALPHAALAWANPALLGAEVYDSLTGSRSVPGAPTYNRWFLVPPDFAATRRAVVVASDLGIDAAGRPAAQGGLYAYSCIDMACPARGAFLGEGVSNNFGTLPGRSYVHVSDLVHPGVVHRTDDGGATWKPWASLTPVLRQIVDPAPHLTITASPDAPSRLFLYVAGGDTVMRDARTPAFQLFRSDDGGETWRVLRTVEPGPSAYSDMTATGDGVLCLYERKGTLTLARLGGE
jgi:hypothetical protein